MSGDGWTRRRFFRTVGGGGVAAVALGSSAFAGYVWPHPSQSPEAAPAPAAPDTDGFHRFHSRPDLRPPRLTVTHRGAARRRLPARPRHLFTAPKGYTGSGGPGQQGVLISDLAGRPVWFLPSLGTEAVPMNFRTQTYQGKPVLTWWRGKAPGGHGVGECLIYDTSYRPVATVRAGNGLEADLHEFLLTEQDTALILAYRPAPADTSPLGGPKDGFVYAGVVQEIDVATGEVLFEWDSLDHVELAESNAGIPGKGTKDDPLDYFHINSVEVMADGDLLISARNTWALYKVARPAGEVVWRLGGAKSDFAVDPAARFYWQHDARVHGTRISLFDDGASPEKEHQSRGLLLDVDTKKKRVGVARDYRHPAALLADNQGSMQVLPDGRAFVCWGAQPYLSEFAEDGTLLLDARFPPNDQSYRAYTADWTGTPTDPPAVAVGPNEARGVTVYASWNGATEVARWRVLADTTPTALRPVATADRSGFETAIAAISAGPYFVAVALDRKGHELGRSTPVRYP